MSSIGTKFVLAQRFIFNPNNNSLLDTSNGDTLSRLGTNESRILLLFSQKPNQIITRDELHEFVWREQGFRVDDSSLTQAISTLRKGLLDSTKAPKYVKTIPKRGYQFIASVEKTMPLASSKDLPSSLANTDEDVERALIKKNKTSFFWQKSGIQIDSPKLNGLSEDSNAVTQNDSQPQVTKQRSKLFNQLVLTTSVLLPLLVYLILEPPSTKFKLIDTIEGLPLYTTENHSSLNNWKPLINKCVATYLKQHQQKPSGVIATTSSSNSLILNYFHSKPDTNANITIQLVANQKDISAQCE